MDLNMIKGLGPTFRQTLYKNGVLDVEQLVKILPSKVEFLETVKFDSLKMDVKSTLEVTVLTYGELVNDSENSTFSVNCEGNILTVNMKYHYSQSKILTPGKKIKILGVLDSKTNIFEIENFFDIELESFRCTYDVAGLPSSQIQNFSEKGLLILNKFENELPMYIKNKLGISSYSSILSDIHSPNSKNTFINGLKNYTYEMLFSFFTSYYYYILSTSLLRKDEEALGGVRINTVMSEFSDVSVNLKKSLNELLKNFKKNVYTNLLMENSTELDKKIISVISIVSKIAMKKQVVIIAKENFEFYVNLKEELLKYNIKMDVMARKGRNKENFESFNTGKYDVLITLPVHFDTLNTNSVGLVIVDEEDFEIGRRFAINCNNCDTIFLTKSSLGNPINNELFKNIFSLNTTSEVYSLKDIIFNNLFKSDNYNIIKEMLSDDDIKEIVKNVSIDSFDFIATKRFKENKENYDYLKKIIDTQNEGVFKK